MFRLPEVPFGEIEVSCRPFKSGRFGSFYKCKKHGETFVLKSARPFQHPGQSYELMVHDELRRSDLHDLHFVAQFFTSVTYGVRLIGFPPMLCSVSEYVRGLQGGRITEREGMFMWLQLANALNYLHVVNGLVHLDVNPGNAFIREDGNVLLSDFSKALKTGADGTFVVPKKIPSASYKHPVLQLRTKSTTDGRVDFWSLMLSVYRMVAGEDADEFVVSSEASYDAVKIRGPLYRADVSLAFRSWVHQYLSDSDEGFAKVYQSTTDGAVLLPQVADVDHSTMYHGKCVTFGERMGTRISEQG
ncbi:hypothetical protein HDE_12957 [Halotydeus destructor]|nr:hypothetical protein HDE_12957 [Halotydeus destructor]